MNTLKKDRLDRFCRISLIFIDNDAINNVYSYLSKPKLFNVEKQLNQLQLHAEDEDTYNDALLRSIPPSFIVSSAKAGLGKTSRVESEANKKGLKVIHFPIGGNINFQNLEKRLN